MYTLFAILLLCSTWYTSFGEFSPSDLKGAWGNELGSLMLISQADNGRLAGKYCTAVETKHGAAGGEQVLYGVVGDKRQRSFGFAVSFKNGSSTSTWSGQYQICNGKEALFTTWILTSSADKCGDVWMATRVGQDKFFRIEKYECKPIPEKIKHTEDKETPEQWAENLLQQWG